jgi:hypothetical protein|tara:strand:- start:1158 stop:1340 length:183 start_codon:yes stop_codon:yes gene_type:complete
MAKRRIFGSPSRGFFVANNKGIVQSKFKIDDPKTKRKKIVTGVRIFNTKKQAQKFLRRAK